MNITLRHLELAIDELNREAGRPITTWTRVAPSSYEANIGNFHLYEPMGGVMLHEVANRGGAARDVFGATIHSKRVLHQLITAMTAGIKLGKEMSAKTK